MVGEKQHTQEERVKIIQKGVRALASTQDAGEDPWGPTLAKERQNVSFCLNQLRHYLRDTEDPDEKYKQELQALSLLVARTGTIKDLVRSALSLLVAHMGLIKDLVRSIALIDFEGRKIVSLVFRQLLQRYAKADDGFTVAYLRRNSEILTDLIRGYALADASSACCGQMLRECAKHEDLARFLLNNKEGMREFFQHVHLSGFDEGMRELFQHVHLAEFDVASDAFASLRELLVTHKLCRS
ncbi:Mo25-like-domain-containing protein [Baffinella frigidus]|nr:Mo25-like-domain-containing protein [Cryptophyta sp. CCMP2293]